MKRWIRYSWVSRSLAAAWVSLMVLLMATSSGCAPAATEAVEPAGPSYADLVVTLNAEEQTLDRLKREQKDLEAELANLQRPDRLELLEGVMQAATDLGTVAEGTDLSDIDQLLEHANQQSAAAAEMTDKLKQALAEDAEGSGESAEKTPEQLEIEEKLAALDAKIAEQQTRVDRAREARDAAEANR